MKNVVLDTISGVLFNELVERLNRIANIRFDHTLDTAYGASVNVSADNDLWAARLPIVANDEFALVCDKHVEVARNNCTTFDITQLTEKYFEGSGYKS